MATFSVCVTAFPPPSQTLTPPSYVSPTSRYLHLPAPMVAAARRTRPSAVVVRAAVDCEYSTKRSSSEPRETIMLPWCDYNHWLIVMEFRKDPAPTREQVIDTYLDTLATVLGRLGGVDMKHKSMLPLGLTSVILSVSAWRKRKRTCLPGVLWVLLDSYIDVKNMDYGVDKYINGVIIPCQCPTYQPKQRNNARYEKRYERRRDGPPRQRSRPRAQGKRRLLQMQTHHLHEVRYLIGLGLVSKWAMLISSGHPLLCSKEP